MSDRLLNPACSIALKLPVALALALILFGSGTHAQPVDWSGYQSGRSRVSYYEGTGPNGEQWTGRAYTSGHTTYFDAYGPNGQVKHCTSYKLGLSTYADCPLPPLPSATPASARTHPSKHERTGARIAVDRHQAREQHRHRDGRGVVEAGSGTGAVRKAKGIEVAGASH